MSVMVLVPTGGDDPHRARALQLLLDYYLDFFDFDVVMVDLFGLPDEAVEWEKLQSGSHGCVAIRRDCWQRVGGLDPAFGMAGYEDLAFNTVCEAFWPSRRVAGDLYHLWHPRGWDADPEREAANLARYREQYLAHWGDREALLEVRHG